ncbi:MAG: hypothetical protein A3B31_01815 [Candidatus Komeilibacteria bacterium RIFCSPLOWO2_01_FULL_53_11]|uniref:Uncharacterized protein n=1 Tax=Candidatus Komeilibacteria bacterium RIFCSPLOWO2_01_FULL_53_11 TaxID=1798552 RepID=A0A1G2BXD9_9BACT|nr:MAG: hypothetical protein A3B31_01815 [Candidatus Komeilibacteria bacterium RIFCSPLOWO2_01_FULL_53_11]
MTKKPVHMTRTLKKMNAVVSLIVERCFTDTIITFSDVVRMPLSPIAVQAQKKAGHPAERDGRQRNQSTGRT